MNAKNIMRVFALLLVAVMAIGVFAGCAPAETKPAGTTAGTPAGTTAAKPQGTTAVQIPEDLTLKILVANDSKSWDFHDREQYNVWAPFAKMCEDKNLTIEWEIVEKDQYQNTLIGYMAGPKGDMPDAFWMDESMLSTALRVQLAGNGRLTPIEDVLPFSDGTAKAWYESHPTYQKRTAIDGKTYWFGEYQEVVWHGETVPLGAGAPKGVTIRLDWYNKLVADGHWDATKGYPDTADEIQEFIHACQDNDVNQTGEVDEWLSGYYISDITGCAINNLYGVPRQNFGIDLTTGKVTAAWKAEGAKAMMTEIIEWNKEGLLDERMVGASSGSTKTRTGNNTAVYPAYFNDNWGFAKCVVPEGADPALIVGIIPDKTVHPNAYIASDSAPTMDNRSMAFTSNLSHPAAAAALLDIVTSDEYGVLMMWGTPITDDKGKDSTTGTYFINAEGKYEYTNVDMGTGNGDSYMTYGANLMGYYVLPRVGNVYDLVEDENCCDVDASGEMLKAFKIARDTTKWTLDHPDQPNAYYAVPTNEETMLLSQFESDYQALSKEIFYDLITGERSIDEWDDIIAELDDAGMSDMEAVYQARFDRFLAD